jgi:hypothetical protein
MNVIKLFTRHGSIYVNSEELARQRKYLTIYDKHGEQLSYSGKTSAIREKASFGVHFNNLFATSKLAKEDSERVFNEIMKL